MLKPNAEGVYLTSAPDFQLSRLEVSGPLALPASGAQVLLAIHGEVTANDLVLKQGDSVFIGADEGPIELSGHGLVFRATSG